MLTMCHGQVVVSCLGFTFFFHNSVTPFFPFPVLIMAQVPQFIPVLAVKKTLRHRKVQSLDQTHTATRYKKGLGSSHSDWLSLKHPAHCFCRDMLMCQKTKSPDFRLVIILSGSVIPPNSQRIIISSCLQTQVQPYAKLWSPGVPEVTVTP